MADTAATGPVEKTGHSLYVYFYDCIYSGGALKEVTIGAKKSLQPFGANPSVRHF